MTLHLSPEERAAHKRELERQRKERYRQRQVDKAQELRDWCERVEAQNAALMKQIEQLHGGYERMRMQYEELKNAPPEQRIVTKIEFKEIPVKRPPPTCIGDIMGMVNYADDVWLANLAPEIEPKLRPFLNCPKCGDREGPFAR